MATEILIAKHREKAEVYYGADKCKKKFCELMESFNLPKGLVPMDDDVTELGFDKETGFIWNLRKTKKEHVYKGLPSKVYFDTTVTAFVETGKMKQTTGVKAKELFITLSIKEMYMTDPTSDKITFLTAGGIKKTHVRSAFELED